jgi:hypothetical protein
VSLVVERQKRPTDPAETLVTGTGRVEPSAGRGHWRYDVSALFAPPSETTSPGTTSSPPATPPPAPLDVVEVIWTPTDIYVRVADVKTGSWESRSREDGRRSGGLIGRLPDEPLGLVTLVANSDPREATPLDSADLGGATAERWLVTVPLETATAAGVPPELPDAKAMRAQYGITDLPIEVWVVDDTVRRLRVALHRDAAPYGGPDTTTTTYDWLPARDTVPIEIPH